MPLASSLACRERLDDHAPLRRALNRHRAHAQEATFCPARAVHPESPGRSTTHRKATEKRCALSTVSRRFGPRKTHRLRQVVQRGEAHAGPSLEGAAPAEGAPSATGAEAAGPAASRAPAWSIPHVHALYSIRGPGCRGAGSASILGARCRRPRAAADWGWALSGECRRGLSDLLELLMERDVEPLLNGCLRCTQIDHALELDLPRLRRERLDELDS